MTQSARGARRDVPLVVLAAGKATRYGGVKPLAPVGVGGEAVIDILASDALAAGFSSLVLVIGDDTGAAVRYHVERTWPDDVDVRFAVQPTADGTVGAVHAAASELDPACHFAVANADDLPGSGALAHLAAHLAEGPATGMVVAFRLADTVIGPSPVTRGLCRVSAEGTLTALDERREVTRCPDGRFVAHDGREPGELDPDQPVSMNLWGFPPAMHEVVARQMAEPNDGEVLLPVLVHGMVTAREGGTPQSDGSRGRERRADGFRIEVVHAPGRCIGVTHPEDVPLVNAVLAREVGRGERPASLWTYLGTDRVVTQVP